MAARFDWDDKDTWPSDRKQFVFLASAVEAYATAKFGANWKPQKRQACIDIADSIAEGELRFVVRPEQGGEFSEFQPYGVFNSEDAIKLFDRCMWTPHYYLGRGQSASISNFYLFVERSDLDALIRPAPPPAESASDTPDEAVTPMDAREEASTVPASAKNLTTGDKGFLNAIKLEFPDGIPDDGTPTKVIHGRILKRAERPRGERALRKFFKEVREGRIQLLS